MGSKDMEKLAELVDASLKFTRVLKKKGVSQATLQVAVRCRPLTPTERGLGSRPITKLIDNKVVVVMDPEPNNPGRNMYGRKEGWEKCYAINNTYTPVILNIEYI